MTDISLIVAMSRNGVIGRGNQLPWRLPEDLRHFKRATLGKPVVMGRRTFESIGFALPGRTNIVLTRNPRFAAEGVHTVHDLRRAMTLCEEMTHAGSRPQSSCHRPENPSGEEMTHAARRHAGVGEISAPAAGEAREIMIIGGAEIFREALPLAGRIYLTEVHAGVEGDVFFPAFDRSRWHETAREDFQAEGDNPYDYSFVLLERKQ